MSSSGNFIIFFQIFFLFYYRTDCHMVMKCDVSSLNKDITIFGVKVTGQERAYYRYP